MAAKIPKNVLNYVKSSNKVHYLQFHLPVPDLGIFTKFSYKNAKYNLKWLALNGPKSKMAAKMPLIRL